MVWSGPSVVLNLCGGDQAFINVSVARRPGVLTMIVDVLERHSIDVVTAQIASDQSRSLFTIHTSVSIPLPSCFFGRFFFLVQTCLVFKKLATVGKIEFL